MRGYWKKGPDAAAARTGIGWISRAGLPPWGVWKLLRQALAIAISGVLNWNLSRWNDGLEVLQERPRRRQLQTLPDRVNRLIAYCQANGISNL